MAPLAVRGGERRGAEVWSLPATADGRVDLGALAGALAAAGVTSVLAEGGGAIHAGLIAAGWAPGAINPLVLAPEVVRLGSSGDADAVMALGRVALADDPAAAAAYLADVPLEVLRLTATAPPSPGPPTDWSPR